MNSQTHSFFASSQVAALALAGLCGCNPDGAADIDPIYDDALDADQRSSAINGLDLRGPNMSDRAGGQLPASSNSAQADFDGDGYTDLAIGVPFDTIDDIEAGAVNILYGSATGLTASGNQLWNQGSPGVLGDPEQYDNFGLTLAANDFDGDGYADLAIGVPFDDVSLVPSGAVNVLYGSATGLTAVGDQLWRQNSPYIEGEAQHLDGFGYALTTGDFDGDGHADLAVGVPFDGLSGGRSAGSVSVIYGSPGGLTATGDQLWDQDTPGVDGIVEPFDLFGGALAAGDFNNDGYDDLVIGVPREDLGSIYNAGSVNVLYGSGSGLTASGDQSWDQDSKGVIDLAEAGDQFGDSLTVGDFDDDGFDDLAVGVPFEDLDAASDAGAVNILYGSKRGLTAARDQFWHGEGEAGELFGFALAAGDFDDDGRDDLAIGVPGADLGDIGDIENAGLVKLLYSCNSGLSETGAQIWHQDREDVIGYARADDLFGFALSVGDFDTNGAADLVIGVPSRDVGSAKDAGAVNVLYGSEAGLAGAGGQLWDQDSPGVCGVAEPGDGFGSAAG